jgi:hypothetical protein
MPLNPALSKAGAYRKHAIYGAEGARYAGLLGQQGLRKKIALDLQARGNSSPSEKDIDQGVRAHMCLVRANAKQKRRSK